MKHSHGSCCRFCGNIVNGKISNDNASEADKNMVWISNGVDIEMIYFVQLCNGGDVEKMLGKNQACI